MKADFLDAHQRHWDDAEHLLQAQRWANADHLYGFAAECGLKAVVAGVVEDAPQREVVIEPLGVTLGHELFNLKK